MSFTSTFWSRLCRSWRQFTDGGPEARLRRFTRPLQVEYLETRDVPAGMGIGMNLEWVQDYSPAWTFKDVFLCSRSWQSLGYNVDTRVLSFGTGGDVQVDSHGWPTALNDFTNAQGQHIQQQLGTLMFDALNGAYPGGTYRAEWQGTGNVVWLGDARVSEQGTMANGTHYALLAVTPGNTGIMMRIASMSTADPIHEVHVWMPDWNGQSFAGSTWHPGDAGSPFHPLFTQRLEPFSAIRFMHWGHTETSDIMHWDDRRPADHARQGTFATDFQNGVSPEYMMALANQLDADPWLNMPHLADDDYVRHLATYVRDTLDPGLKVYVEWSNEVWNFAPGFEATAWVASQVRSADNPGLTHEQIVARETRRDFAIWSEVFAGQEDRLVRVVGGFSANPGFARQVLASMNGEFDAVAIAPYMSIPNPQRVALSASTTPDQVIDMLYNNLPAVLDNVSQHRQMVDQYAASLGRHIQLLAYEGGTHLDDRNEPYQPAFFDAEVSPRMYDLYQRYLQGLSDRGLDLFMNFKYTDRHNPALINDDFGVLNRQDQSLDTAYKYRALVDAVNRGVTPTLPVQADPNQLRQQPVLMVIANQDFYYQEYADTRRSLEEAGLHVEVAAVRRDLAFPHIASGQPSSGGAVMPDLAIADADASRYSAVVFVGGWGSSAYQYAFPGTYQTFAYNGQGMTEIVANRLIGDFVHQGKYVTAICHGVTDLAWARVDGVSPIAGHTVAAYAGESPPWRENTGQYPNTTRWHVESNGATMVASRSIGDPTTAADDVIVDGHIITAENYDSARQFGRVVAAAIITASNSAPGNAAISGPTSAVRGQAVSFTGTFSDPDAGDTFTLLWQVRDAGGSLLAEGHTATFDFTPVDTGRYSVTFRVVDQDGGSAETIRSLDVSVVALQGTTLVVGGTAGNDVIQFTQTPRPDMVGVMLNGQWLGAFSGVTRLMAFGQAGNDQLCAGNLAIAAWLDGGAGDDCLKGGNGDDVLIGGAGVDQLDGGPGQNIVLQNIVAPTDQLLLA